MPEVALPHQAEKNLRWNFSVNLVDIIFITLGLSIVSRDTVMPLLVSQLTDSKIAVGLIPAIFSLGFYLPQLLTANFTEGLRYKKPFVMWIGGLCERIPYALIGGAVLLFAVDMPLAALVVVLLGLGASAFGAGIATPAWFDMIAKVIPVSRRGIWSGSGHSVGAMLGIVGALFAGQILERYAFPLNFAILFAIASTALAISWGGLALNREPPSEIAAERVPIRRYLRRLPAVLRNNRNYTRFLVGRTTIQLGTMANGFFLLYGIERFGVSGATVGTLTAVLVATQAVMNLVWGVVGDRWGHKVVLAGAALGMALASILALFATSWIWLIPIFILVGVYTAADMVSALNIILEFCSPHERPTYIGLTNTLLAPVVTLAPLIGGWLATWGGYPTLFVTALAVALVGWFLLSFWVQEPRKT